jgi:hypothetical protein
MMAVERRMDMDTNDLPNAAQVDAVVLEITRERLAIARSLVTPESDPTVRLMLTAAEFCALTWPASASSDALKGLHALAEKLVEALAHPPLATTTTLQDPPRLEIAQ